MAGPAAVSLMGRVLLRDANLIILDKPAGLPVHGGPKARSSVEDLLPSLKFGLRHVPAPAHRLDQDTSGCLVLARHPKALSRLGRLFTDGKVEKTYWAIVTGPLPGEAGTIDRALLKQTDRSGWRMVVDEHKGQRAVTHWRRLGGTGQFSWLELTLETGRTHQIRVHLAALGCPVLGDPVYGEARPDGKMHLLSRRLAVPYWQDRPPVAATAEPPPHMRMPLTACGWVSSPAPSP
ncbi:MAG TPA: RNA pseudouridine synthase [Aliidongia sp.]|nr:RNA pseudouridine synthase [Aliidongia sp.]